jgi:hypothetical protein
MAIILPTQWTRQPQIPVGINRANPSSQNLQFAFHPSYGDLANRRTQTVTGTNEVLAVTKEGIARPFVSASGDYDAFSPVPGIDGTTNFSILVKAIWTSNAQDVGNGVYGSICARQQDGSFSEKLIGLDAADPTTGKLVFHPYAFGTPVTTSTAVGLNVWRTVLVTSISGAQNVYLDGVSVGTGSLTGSGNSNTGTAFTLGAWANAGSSNMDGKIALAYVWDRAITPAEVQSVSANPWQLFAPLPRRIFVQSGAASNDGTLARTNANDTSAASGSQTNTGTLARTNANDTSAASGSQTNTGTLARTNANDSVSAAGNLGTFNGTVAYTNANDTSAASGSQTNTGTLARTNANDTSAASGTQTNTGTLARTNANDSVAASGSAGTISGTVAYTNANDRLSATGGGGQTRGGMQRLKETKVKKSSTAVRDLLTETIDPQPAEVAEIAEEMREAVLEPKKAEAAAPIIAQPVPEVEDKEKEARRIARRRSVMHLLLLDDMSIQSHAEEVTNEAEVKRQALIADVKASLRQAIARRKNANG